MYDCACDRFTLTGIISSRANCCLNDKYDLLCVHDVCLLMINALNTQTSNKNQKIYL